MKIDVIRQGGLSGGGLSIAGGSLTGPLMLSRDPQTSLEAATKQYIDASLNSINAGNFSTGVLPIARLPALSGDVSSVAGDNNISLSISGVVPGSYSKINVNSKGRATTGDVIVASDIPFLNYNKITTGNPTTLTGYGITDGVNLSGGVLTGPLTLHANPVSDSHLVTKQYIDGIVGGLSGAKLGDVVRKPFSETPSGFLKCNGAEISKTTYANLYAVIGDSYSSNSVAGNGKPWQQQYQINDQQSVNIGNWSASTAMASGLGYSAVVVTINRVYLLGGSDGNGAQSTVRTAPINSDGTLGTWATTTSMPVVLHSHSAIVTKKRIYVIAGWPNGATTSCITAPINSDGTLGAWTNGPLLPTVLTLFQVITTKNRVYVLGGDNGAGTYLANVYTAVINSDGTLGAWSSATSMPGPLGRSAVIVTKDRVYMCGGYNGSVYVSTVYTAPINNDGTLGTWSTGTSLPGLHGVTQSIVTKNRAYLLGGYNGSAYTSTVYTAVINSDGTLGTWTTGTSLLSNHLFGMSFVTKNRIYMMGGTDGGLSVTNVYTAPITGGLNDYSSYYTEDSTNYMVAGSGQPWKQQYQINETQSTDITGWVTGTALPGIIAYHQAIVTKNRVYIMGGHNGSAYVSTVWTAPINSDGTLGAWITGTSLPVALINHTAIITKNRVYLLGSITTSYTAPINSDGTLGTWVTGTSLPGVLNDSQAIVTKNRVYLLGGTGSVVVYTAPFDNTGTIGTWVTGPSIPGAVGLSSVAVTKNRVYLIGGWNGATTSTIYTAFINSDGVLSSWTSASSLHTGSSHSQCIVTKNRIYLLSNQNGGNSVFSAPINIDGTLGTWVTVTALPGTLNHSQAIVTKNRVYLLGGHNGTAFVSTVYSAPILEGLNDYSPWYDGTVIPMEPINPTTTFKIPDFSSVDVNAIYHYIKF